MNDDAIVELYWQRDESALAVTQEKYNAYLMKIARNILNNSEDSEESVNDTYLAAWNAMPTDRPTYLGAFLSRITRNLSIDRYRKSHRDKRGGMENLLEELTECVPDTNSVQKEYENGMLADALADEAALDEELPPHAVSTNAKDSVMANAAIFPIVFMVLPSLVV
jgi:RNA polymerase sigma-70 factor (ECF subfamily)